MVREACAELILAVFGSSRTAAVVAVAEVAEATRTAPASKYRAGMFLKGCEEGIVCARCVQGARLKICDGTSRLRGHIARAVDPNILVSG